jgi:hypothetical protein
MMWECRPPHQASAALAVALHAPEAVIGKCAGFEAVTDVR